MKIADHNEWLVSPRLWKALLAVPECPKLLLPSGLLRRMDDVYVHKEPALIETQMMLLKNGQIVQVIEIEWAEPQHVG